MIHSDLWKKHRPENNPFLSFEFMYALVESGCATPETGWSEASIATDEGVLLNFIKTHSYGEYIFDWGWAEAFAKHGIPYYPKSTSMIPFSPVSTQHFLMKEFDEEKCLRLLRKHDDDFSASTLSSAHFLFLEHREIPIFEKNHYLIRESIQYHFYNSHYSSFEDFLGNLKSKKAKTIRKERSLEGISIKQFSGHELTQEHADKMYEFYISTIEHKNSYDYLNQEFFRSIFKNLKNNVLYIEASKDNVSIAGSLFFYDHEKLYGRYWGASQYIENLHFELCYYQGIDFCIKNKIPVFEAGAQGEHKIARGFRPVKIFSAHKIKHPAFHNAIAEFIENEKAYVAKAILNLSAHLPFKTQNP